MGATTCNITAGLLGDYSCSGGTIATALSINGGTGLVKGVTPASGATSFIVLYSNLNISSGSNFFVVTLTWQAGTITPNPPLDDEVAYLQLTFNCSPSVSGNGYVYCTGSNGTTYQAESTSINVEIN